MRESVNQHGLHLHGHSAHARTGLSKSINPSRSFVPGASGPADPAYIRTASETDGIPMVEDRHTIDETTVQYLLTIAGNWLAEEAGEGLQIAGQCGAPFFYRALCDFGDLPPAGGHGLGGLRP